MQLRIDAAGLTSDTAIITACGHVFNRDTFNGLLKNNNGVCPKCTDKINRPHIWGPCLPFTQYVWNDEINQIKCMLFSIETLRGTEKIARIREMFEFMLNKPGFLASAAQHKFGTTVQDKIKEIRSQSGEKHKPLHPVVARVEAALLNK